MKKVFSIFSLFLPLLLHADIVGNYTLEGTDPLKSSYTGEALITRDGDVFNINWYYNDGSSDIGTGVRMNNKIAFTYQGTQHPNENGVILYYVNSNNIMNGTWVMQGGSVTGTEKMHPK